MLFSQFLVFNVCLTIYLTNSYLVLAQFNKLSYVLSANSVKETTSKYYNVSK